MGETLSLMEFLQALLADTGLRGAFCDDPRGTLAAHGLADLSPADVHDALVLVQDTQTVDYSVDTATAPPPPPPAGDGHGAAVEYLARYLADPHAPLGGFGTGSDLPLDDGGWAALPPEPDHAPDLHDLGHFEEFAELTAYADVPDLPDLLDDVADGHETGPAWPEGA
jgi:hypothetical protein